MPPIQMNKSELIPIRHLRNENGTGSQKKSYTIVSGIGVLAGQLLADFVFLFLVTVQVATAVLVFQNNETAAMLVFQTNLVGVKLFPYVNAFCCSKTLAEMLATWVKRLYGSNARLN